ncbi:MCM DNA helicase complex subunit [Dinochytrium kinnereticum]|nr:MCM DNA helicase complex subunit [Dinochytrium kinnereticum]
MEEPNALRNLNADDQFNERVRFFQDFLDRDLGENENKEKIRKMLAATGRRLILNINSIRAHSAEYAEGILNTPVDYVPAFDRALKDVVTAIDTFPAAKPAYTNHGQISMDDVQFWVGFEGSFGENVLSPRKLEARFLGRTVCLEGIVTKCSLVRPKLMKSVHYCEKTEVFHSREYRDGLSLSHAVPTISAFPKMDEDGNPLSTEYGLCVYRDFQTLTLQEMPERSPAGQLPRPIDIILEDDLVDSAKPGDRIQVVGVYRTRGGKGNAATSATFSTVVLANNIRHLGREAQQLTLSDLDIRNIKKIGKRKDLFDLLAHSLAPSIFGHDMIKRAILLLLVSGVEKNLPNGTHLRGDINMLMIGDPSTAKSQLLRFVLNTAPLAIATTGRGSTGVGLTAAVTQDKETGERTLEAGAMVLADRGVVCIDEFDKMSDIDRVAIHEVMEQQTVTIAKAGIHTSLNARCSVIAAANPAFGRYDNEKSPHQNIPLPDSLLSRFDLIFVVLDNMGDEHNRKIAEHIIRLHQFVPPGLEEGAPIQDNTIAGFFSMSSEANDDPHRDDVFLKYNKLLHIGIPATGRGQKAKVEILAMPFIKKFIHYVKSRIKPVLTEEARVAIGETYGRLRMEKDGQEEKFRTMPITPRTLETLIRISSAHAKLRLSSRVEKEDTDAATAILEFALYQKVDKKKRNKRLKVDGADGSDEGEDSDDSDDDGGNNAGTANESGAPQSGSATPRSARKTRTSQRTSPGEPGVVGRMSQLALSSAAGDFGEDDSMVVPDSQETRIDALLGGFSQDSSRRSRGSQSSAPARAEPDAMVIEQEIEPERYTFFKEVAFPPINMQLRTTDELTIAMADLLTQMNSALPMSKHFTADEVVAAVKRLTSEETSFMYDEELAQLILV